LREWFGGESFSQHISSTAGKWAASFALYLDSYLAK
jgi:hypothetical protein